MESGDSVTFNGRSVLEKVSFFLVKRETVLMQNYLAKIMPNKIRFSRTGPYIPFLVDSWKYSEKKSLFSIGN